MSDNLSLSGRLRTLKETAICVPKNKNEKWDAALIKHIDVVNVEGKGKTELVYDRNICEFRARTPKGVQGVYYGDYGGAVDQIRKDVENGKLKFK